MEPTHFFAVRIDSKEIQNRVLNVQNHICSLDKRVQSTIIDVKELHLTCCVVNISQPDILSRAINALEETILVLRESLLSYPISMNFAGIGHFRNKVLYANLLEDAYGSRSRVLHLSEILKEKLIQRGVYVVDKRPMTPHLTIIKLSKDENIFSKGLRQIHPSLYEVYSAASFGACVINSIQLCERGERDSSGYYKIVREVSIIPSVPRALTMSLERSEPAKIRKIYPVEEDNVTVIN